MGQMQDKVNEVMALTKSLRGGPAYMYMTPLLNALDEFLPEQN